MMKLKGITVLVLALAILFLPVSQVGAASTAAEMVTKGDATVNGTSAPSVTSVFAGDSISTAKKTVTSLNFSGGDAVVIPELTRASLAESDGHVVVNLEEGSVSVLNKAQSPLVIMARGARITAVNQPALFDVTLHGNELRVIARDGAARVETANRTGVATRGTAVSATMSPSKPGSKPVVALGASNGLVLTAVAMGAAGAIVGGVSYADESHCAASPSTNDGCAF
jgi:hypothetical protein